MLHLVVGDAHLDDDEQEIYRVHIIMVGSGNPGWFGRVVLELYPQYTRMAHMFTFISLPVDQPVK